MRSAKIKTENNLKIWMSLSRDINLPAVNVTRNIYIQKKKYMYCIYKKMSFNPRFQTGLPLAYYLRKVETLYLTFLLIYLKFIFIKNN